MTPPPALQSMQVHTTRRGAAALAAASALAVVAAAGLAACGDEDEAPVCKASLCAAAPLPACDGQTRIVYAAIGSCIETGGGGYRCEYPIVQSQDCTTLEGRICEAGQCVAQQPIPCQDVVCNDPPAPDCDGDTARIYALTGTCDPARGELGECVYPVDVTLNCAELGRSCRDGGCPDPNATPCDPNPCNVPPPGTCDGPAPRRYDAPGACTQRGSGVTAYECDFTLNEFTECSGQTPFCAGGQCGTAARAPTAGELVIHEVMVNPFGEGDEGEWIELYNPTQAALDLNGCLLTDDGSNRHTFSTNDLGEGMGAGSTLLVPPLGYVVLGRSGDRDDAGGFLPDIVYSNFQLGNSRDAIELVCDGAEIDRVAWDSGTWPVRPDASMSLRAGSANTAANDAPEAWCRSATFYGDGRNAGTPRAANGSCAE